MDFNNHYAFEIKLGGQSFFLMESTMVLLFIAAILIVIAVAIRIAIRNPKKIPTGVQNVVEMIVEMLDKFTLTTMGPKYIGFSSFYGSMFILILLCNLSGLFLGPTIVTDPETLKNSLSFGFMRPPTADFTVTFALAMITFCMIQGFAIKAKGVGRWLKGLTEPMWPLTPLNVIGELANPVSLSFRLFGNILGGTIIMGLVYSLPWYIYLVTPALHGYFDIFAGALQAFIFVMLSMTFVSTAMED